jgi:TetR/AcrR family transcriptional repressor of bet genes
LNEYSGIFTGIQLVNSGRSFIEEARRAQIVAAAIETLADSGYVKSSLAQIAKRAGISTSLIPYHFKDKDDLMAQTIHEVSHAWLTYVTEKVGQGQSARDKLRLYIEANLAYMGTRPKHFTALMEIVFNSRDSEGTLIYLNETGDPGMQPLLTLLADGQANGEFRSFHVQHMATAIRGALDGFLSQAHISGADLEAFTAEMVTLFDHATRREQASP